MQSARRVTLPFIKPCPHCRTLNLEVQATSVRLCSGAVWFACDGCGVVLMLGTVETRDERASA